MTTFDQRHQRVFGAQINADAVHINPSDGPEELMSYGRRAVAERLYKRAAEYFTEAIAKGAPGSDPHYYLALALLGGRRPSRMGREAQQVMARVEEHLGRALQVDPAAAHVRALWVAVKRDHYADRHDPGPSVADLEAGAGDIDPVHAAEIAPFLGNRENRLWKATVAVAQAGIEERKPNVRKYFVRTPVPPVTGGPQAMMVAGGIGLAVALILMIASLSESGYLCLAVLVGAGGIVLLVKGFSQYNALTSKYERDLAAAEPKPSDEQMDMWLHFDKFGVLDHALRHLDRELDDLICEPQLVIGPASPTEQAVGKDGIRRFSRYKFVILLLGQTRISVFSCEWDFVKCIVSNADAFDFRYKDITGLRTRQLHEAPQGGRLVITDDHGKEMEVRFAKVFEMIIAGTDRIAVTIDVQAQNAGAGLQPTGATATERLVRRQLDDAA
ncbi:hypothetical protein DER29_2065 [Micromonospora sp. M71_S20]|uniref:hypothetical protein n=1 Tax=Micromonospora sp. M71_S20 TaxID=592872 RepID=UPI000EB08500|nr:hypothetical protein [Micromonospora sp. M71_S20]RLK24168.1 hypothetical protein DER29_2065 [Micromonospora sp. M71_S20]